ncbi:SPASM domain-containing protein [Bradyrhizobium diazoefficiens]|nr:SPASM domain-containing protein [Bradyrhizobium diazoefficiens]MBR0850362.1 SPASM domain-containing protein [Bradyrhizobium diazoefficiens]
MNVSALPDNAPRLFRDSRPRSRDAHLLESGGVHQLFLPQGSRLFEIDSATAAQFGADLRAADHSALQQRLAGLELGCAPYVNDTPPQGLRVRALSLAIAQSCNLGCSYCYARGGEFGGAAKAMSQQIAHRSVDLLLSQVAPGERVNLAFLGGEPLANREVLHDATRYAAAQAERMRVPLTFSITTNGTLVSASDIDLFERHCFAVTVSLDGTEATHDRLRPFKRGSGSYARIMANIAPMLARQNGMQVSARVTVTPRNLDLRATLDSFVARGFHSVGFSPMLSAPDHADEMQHGDLGAMLEQMVDCGEAFVRQSLAGCRYPFANLLNALREIHKGTHRPYPCGAGGGYFGVSADGELSACHRFVGDDSGRMGDLASGVDLDRQSLWLAGRHVHKQEPCSSCWARYLCGGSCHHEAMHRGRPACDFIRGWLHYCLTVYGRMSRARPEMFEQTSLAAHQEA